MVDIMVNSGMKDAGYEYVIIDDNWTGPRDSLGFLTVDKSRFPSGMNAMSAYIHSKGLKLGLYSDAGYKLAEGILQAEDMNFKMPLCLRAGRPITSNMIGAILKD